MKSLTFTLFLLGLFLSCTPPEKGTFSLNPLFTDHMVLQQQTEVALWGTYEGHGPITVQASWGDEAEGILDNNGKWQATLSTPAAGGPFEVTLNSADTSITIGDIFIGEVWVASGQSNMEMPVKGWPPNDPIENSAQEIAQADYPQIRMFTVEKIFTTTPVEQVSGQWEVASPQTVGDFSASAYFFARRLHEELSVPIGIIHSSWGGTVAEAWTSEEQLKTLGDFDEEIQKISDAEMQRKIDDWFYPLNTAPMPQSNEQWDQLDLGKLATGLDYEDSAWDTLQLPGRFDDLPMGNINGAVWLRYEFHVDTPESEYTLNIGSIDDLDVTYINGTKVGSAVGYNLPRSYKIPADLITAGQNSISIRAIDTGGPGEVNGPISLTGGQGRVIELSGTWKYRLAAEIYNGSFYLYEAETDLSTRPDVYSLHPNVPTVLFNGMLHPLIPYTIKGAIWYQGESNVGRAEQYQRLFPAMIEDWRTRWGYDFSFYYVQIAPFRYHQSDDYNLDQSQKLRDAQRLSLKTPGTGMVVTMDIGNVTNIHPANKQDVGARLAGLALASDYGQSLVALGPLYKSLEVSGSTLIVDFDHKGSGLMANDVLTGFEIAGADVNFVPANAQIVDNRVQLTAPGISNPKFARYAWRDKVEATLFNQEGLPASSFISN